MSKLIILDFVLDRVLLNSITAESNDTENRVILVLSAEVLLGENIVLQLVVEQQGELAKNNRI